MKVIITAPWPIPSLEGIIQAFPDIQIVATRDPDTITAEVGDADVVLGSLTRDQFLRAKHLKWIQYQGAGVDWIAKIPELLESEVIVTNTRGAHAATIAEHTLGILICLARGFQSLFKGQQERRWIRPLEQPAVGLSGLTMGIIGFGKIGHAIAVRANAFEMNVIAVDVEPLSKPEYVVELWNMEQLPELLAASDVLVVTAPLTEQTRGMIAEKELALMKETAYLLVISRGGIVDEAALGKRLKAGKLAGAGLDVQLQKPVPPESELWDYPNLLITPHCSGESTQTTQNVIAFCRENLQRYLDGQPLQNIVDKHKGY